MFAKCARESSGPNVTILHCGTTDVKVMRPETLNAESMLSQLHPSEWKREQIDLGGNLLPGAISVGEKGPTGVIVAATTGTGPRFVSCFSREVPSAAKTTCKETLMALLATGALADIEFAKPSLEVNGRSLRVPAGCSQPMSDRIRCVGAELHWRDGRQKCTASADELRSSWSVS